MLGRNRPRSLQRQQASYTELPHPACPLSQAVQRPQRLEVQRAAALALASQAALPMQLPPLPALPLPSEDTTPSKLTPGLWA